MMVVKLLYCDYPGCRNTFCARWADTRHKYMREDAAEYGWLYEYVVGVSRMLDLCPVHKHEPLPEG